MTEKVDRVTLALGITDDGSVGVYLRYLGTLKLLEECSPYVTEELRECIERAHNDAAAAHPNLCVRRVVDRCIVEVKQIE